MPIFFFDVEDGETSYRDEFGVELATVVEAAEEAAALLPDMARDMLPKGLPHAFTVSVRDGSGVVVHRAALVFRARWTGEAAPPPHRREVAAASADRTP